MPSAHDRALRSLVRTLIDAGATDHGAETIARSLLASDLTPREASQWIHHRQLAYPHPQPPEHYGGVPVTLVAGTRWCLRRGREDLVIEGAAAFEAASQSERMIARLFSGNIPDVHSLTGGNSIRAEVMAQVASLMLERLGTPQRVATAASAMADENEDRIRDRLRKGEEQAVLRELQDGSLDLEALMRSTWRDPTW
jgi:hypothetical protein